MYRRSTLIVTMAIGLLPVLMVAAPAVQSPLAGVGAQLPVEVQLVEQTACLIDPESFLVSFLLHTTYPNTGGRPVSVVAGSERVTRITVASSRAALLGGQAVRVFADPTQAARAHVAGHTVAAAPGWSVTGRVIAWLPVSIGPERDDSAVAPGDYLAQLTIEVAGHVDSPGDAATTREVVRFEATTRPLAIHIPAPRQEQECGSAAAPLQLVAPPGV